MSALTERDLRHLRTVAGRACTNPDCPSPHSLVTVLADTARATAPDHLDDATLARLLLRLAAVLNNAAEQHNLDGQSTAWCLVRAASELAALDLAEPNHA